MDTARTEPVTFGNRTILLTGKEVFFMSARVITSLLPIKNYLFPCPHTSLNGTSPTSDQSIIKTQVDPQPKLNCNQNRSGWEITTKSSTKIAGKN